MSNIKVTHLNVRSLKSREHFILVRDTITTNSFDIFTISETWLDSSVDEASIQIPGYQLFRQDRGPHKAGGGLCVYITHKMKASIINTLSLASDEGFQQLWLRVQCRSCKSFLVCTVYRPPSTPINFLDNLAHSLVDTLLHGLEIIILGDLNCNLTRNNPESRVLLDFCSTFNLTQLVKTPTRITENSQSLLDVILTTKESFVDSTEVLMSSISDHSLVYTVLKLKTPRTKSSYVSVRSYTNYKPELFLKDLYCVPFHMVNFFDDFNDQVDAFNSLFLDVLNEHAPIKRIKIKSRPNPFITREIRELMRTRDRCRHKSAIKTNDRLHWNAYRFFRQEVKREIRLAEKAHVRSEILNSNGNTNAIWKVINRCLPKKATSRPRSTD